MAPLFTDVEINGTKYQVGRFKARDGSWVVAQVLTKMLPAFLEQAFAKETGANLASNRAMLSEEEFVNLQGHALAVCRRYENGVPMPVFVLPNTWATKDLEYDLTTVMALTIHALVFNIAPFFAEGGLSQLLALLPGLGLNSSDSQT